VSAPISTSPGSASWAVSTPSAVDPLRSQNTTVTTFQTLAGASPRASGAPQLLQNREPATFSRPQELQTTSWMFSASANVRNLSSYQLGPSPSLETLNP
jgi:hypothetical protein